MKLTSLISAGLLLAATAASHAAVIVTLPTATTAGSVVIDVPISFTVTRAGSFSLIALDEWVTSDGANTLLSVLTSTTLSYQINSDPPQTTIGGGLLDNMGFIVGDITTNDGCIYVYPDVPLQEGDLFTVLPGTLVLPAVEEPDFNPAAGQTFTGNLFIADEGGIALSGLTPAGAAVPEPSAALLSLLGVGLLVTRRRMA